MKAINKRFIASFLLSIFLHAFVILLCFIFQHETKDFFVERKIDLKKKDENIVLLSLANYQISEKQKEPSAERAEGFIQNNLIKKEVEPLIEQEITEEQEPIIAKVENEELPIEPQKETVKIPEESLAFNKPELIIEKLKEKISPEKIIARARNILCKNKTSFTKTVTKTDFFRHAHAVAQQPIIQQRHQDLTARISGLGNLKLYSYEEKLRSTLLTAFNSLKHRIDRTIRAEQQHRPAPQPHAAINLIINKDGSIDTLNLITSSGDQFFDKLIIESIEYAAPFPPIPAHLGIDKFRLGAMQLYVRY